MDVSNLGEIYTTSVFKSAQCKRVRIVIFDISNDYFLFLLLFFEYVDFSYLRFRIRVPFAFKKFQFVFEKLKITHVPSFCLGEKRTRYSIKPWIVKDLLRKLKIVNIHYKNVTVYFMEFPNERYETHG